MRERLRKVPSSLESRKVVPMSWLDQQMTKEAPTETFPGTVQKMTRTAKTMTTKTMMMVASKKMSEAVQMTTSAGVAEKTSKESSFLKRMEASAKQTAGWTKPAAVAGTLCWKTFQSSAAAAEAGKMRIQTKKAARARTKASMSQKNQTKTASGSQSAATMWIQSSVKVPGTEVLKMK